MGGFFDDFSGFASDPGGLTEFSANTIPEGWSSAPGPDAFDAPSGLSRFASGIGDVAGKVGGGIASFAKNLGSEVMGSPLKALTGALSLGSTGLGIANQLSTQHQMGQQAAMTAKAQKQAQAAAAPAVDFGTKTLTAASGGNLPPAMQAQIDEWVHKAKADAAARMASMGLGNSTQIDSINRMIDEQGMSMKGAMLQQQEETGLAGLQTGVSAATGVMGSSQQQQQQLSQLIAQANQQLGSMAGRAPAA